MYCVYECVCREYYMCKIILIYVLDSDLLMMLSNNRKHNTRLETIMKNSKSHT